MYPMATEPQYVDGYLVCGSVLNKVEQLEFSFKGDKMITCTST